MYESTTEEEEACGCVECRAIRDEDDETLSAAEAAIAAEWNKAQARRLPDPPFVIPDRLSPSVGVGLMMVRHFKQTPPKGRV